MGALDFDGFELLVLDAQVLPLGGLVATALVLGVERLAGFFIDELLTQSMVALLICRKAMLSAGPSRRRAVRSGPDGV
jgi:hypothetical protein